MAMKYFRFNLDMSPSRITALRRALLFFVLSPTFFLFFGAFSIPYINSVFFVKISINSVAEVVTLGTFGICLELDRVKECSQGVTGYQMDDLFFTGPVQIPISLTITRALTLHVVAFVLALVASTIILCAFFQKSLLARWITEMIILLALFVIASFIVDLALFFSLRTALAGAGASVQIGNGTWLTFGSLLFLLVGMGISTALPKPAPTSEDIEGSSRDSWGDDPVLNMEPSFGEDKEEESHKRYLINLLPYDDAVKAIRTPDAIHSSPKPSVTHHKRASFQAQSPRETSLWMENSGTILEEQLPALKPLRRVPTILINGTPTPSDTWSPITSNLYPTSSYQSPPSAYAPSTYSTCRSDELTSTGISTPQTLSRSSSASRSGTASGRQPARRSTHEWLNYERRNGKVAQSRQDLNSVSSLGSSLGSAVHHFPTIPSPKAVMPASFAFLQLRDRFELQDPAEVRSMASAVPSSDLELDVQTLPSNSPKIPIKRQLPPVPYIVPDSDNISLA